VSDGINRWLENIGLGEYATVFVENAIDEDILSDLSDADLEKIGVKLGHRKKILKTIIALAGEEPTPQVDEADESLAAWERHPGERKPVTTLFADITGSTALTEKLDAEESHDSGEQPGNGLPLHGRWRDGDVWRPHRKRAACRRCL